MSIIDRKEVNTTTKISENIVVNISFLDQYIDRALDIYKIDEDFDNITSLNLIAEHNKIIKQLVDSVNRLDDILIAAIHNNTSYLDSLISKLEYHKHLYELTIYSLTEKGNIFFGYNSNLYNRTIQLKNELNAIPDSGNLKTQLDDISQNYFKTLENNSLQSFLQFIENLPYEFYNFEDFDPITSIKIINDSKEILEQIKSVEIRLIGDDKSTGQIKDLENSINDLEIYAQRMVENLAKDNAKFNLWWILAFIGFWLALSPMIIVPMTIASIRFSKSVQNIINIVSNLKVGRLYSDIKIDPQPEFELIAKNLRTHISELVNRKNFVTEILEEKFDREIELLSDEDEFGTALNKLESKLHKNKNEQEKRAHDNEIRRYINEGLAKFADIMRINSNNTTALGDSLIKNLVKYLDTIQGTIFLTDEEDDELLIMIAAFAYDRKKYLSKTIRFGQGLVGTCAVEKKSINITKVPPNYVTITSGLGDTPPDNILIIPVKHDENVVGVIELVSLNPFKDYQINLTEQIADSLASTIISVRNNTRTAQLLEKSQQQAIEMAEQEEEMRQNMEELKATQEESARREEEMQGILDAIGTTFFVIEYNLDGAIEHINDRLVKFLEQPFESIIGKKHTDIFSSESKISVDLLKKEIIGKRKSDKITEELNWGSRKLKYTHSISPILSKYDEVIKIINLMIIEEN